MNNSDFLIYLKQRSACDEAIQWIGTRDLATAWRECDRIDWMLWLRESANPDKVVYVTLAVRIARDVLPLYTGSSDAPRAAIEAAEKWLADPSEDNRVAAYAANAAALAAYAANAAARAARASANAAAYAAKQKLYADWLRELVPMISLEEVE